ncbi:MAG TPA: bifunctional YncE family protein/alkaline phosphatase family protein [Nevskiaceae bacterium]|nr:bifunctional YncE family protein/alkaline phosphatase family protein [Nevskiaceae bacterium]
MPRTFALLLPLLLLAGPALSAQAPLRGVCGTAFDRPGALGTLRDGRVLYPAGRLTAVGQFPAGGALAPDGRHYWSVSAGRGANDVRIVDLASGEVVQVLPLPGASGAMVFSADGRRAYVSGEPRGDSLPGGPTLADAGDAIHVFAVDPADGHAVEREPLLLPRTAGGHGRETGIPPNPQLPSLPAGIAISPDGQTLLVALHNADLAAVIDLRDGSTRLVPTGAYPQAAAIERSGRYGYIGNLLDGSLTRIDLARAEVVDTFHGLGGSAGDFNAHPQALLADAHADLLYVAVTDRDSIMAVDTRSGALTPLISLRQHAHYGAAPVALALSANGRTLYAAAAGLNAIAQIRLQRGAHLRATLGGLITTADYPQDVQISGDGCTLVWAAARGLGSRPNAERGTPWFDRSVPPRGSSLLEQFAGQVGVLPVPDAHALATLTALARDGLRVPGDAPARSVIPAPGAVSPIQHVFLVIRENRTYDQIFGSIARADGAAALQVAEDNCGAANPQFEGNDRAHPGCGATPNAHALARRFPLLDRFYENSEVSADGHLITTGAYAIDHVLKGLLGEYAARGRAVEENLFPIDFPPRQFLFDQAVRSGVSLRIYGERSGGIIAGRTPDRADTYDAVQDAVEHDYPAMIGCRPHAISIPDTVDCVFDAGLGAAPPHARSRIDVFARRFREQLAAGAVPRFNYLALPNDHTAGTVPGGRTPLAMLADNDLALGQLVQLVSHSAVWHDSAIFVMEDDSQDGPDHVDAHRGPVLVISPWARHGGAVVHTRYDQYSMLRTIELILGLPPLSVHDAGAAPMYDAFALKPDDSPYDAIAPEQSLLAVNAPHAANAQLSQALPFEREDAVPQQLSDLILWQSVFGPLSPPPAPGPHGSAAERQRAEDALLALRNQKQMELPAADDDDD